MKAAARLGASRTKDCLSLVPVRREGMVVPDTCDRAGLLQPAGSIPAVSAAT